MKRSDTGKNFLDFDNFNKILPYELKLDAERHFHGIYCARNDSLISILNSQTYEKINNVGYYVFAARLDESGAKYMLKRPITVLMDVPLS